MLYKWNQLNPQVGSLYSNEILKPKVPECVGHGELRERKKEREKKTGRCFEPADKKNFLIIGLHIPWRMKKPMANFTISFLWTRRGSPGSSYSNVQADQAFWGDVQAELVSRLTLSLSPTKVCRPHKANTADVTWLLISALQTRSYCPQTKAESVGCREMYLPHPWGLEPWVMLCIFFFQKKTKQKKSDFAPGTSFKERTEGKQSSE